MPITIVDCATAVKNKLDRAIEDYTKAIELNPNYTDAYYNRSLVYNYKGDLDRALNDLNRAIQLNPNDHKFLEIRDNIQQTLHQN